MIFTSEIEHLNGKGPLRSGASCLDETLDSEGKFELQKLINQEMSRL
jgi:hypothetical protein